MTQADTKFSAGARLERKAFREYLRRRLAVQTDVGDDKACAEAALILKWVMLRQSRYDKKRGGLGK